MPTMPTPDLFPLFPPEPKKYRQWVLWRLEKTREGKFTKVPYNLAGWKASHADSRTWAHYEPACRKYLANSHKYNGIGFVFSDEDPFTGTDLDHCTDESGNLTPLALLILQELDSYAEWSPSGEGIHIFTKAKLPHQGHKKQDLGIEMYDQLRYFTVTGNHVGSTPLSINARQRQQKYLHRIFFGAPTPGTSPRIALPPLTLSEEAIVAKASSARNGKGDKFKRLYSLGDKSEYGGRSWDDSAADMALCTILAFWCCGDAAMIDKIFRNSRLMRNKWDERRGKRGTYGNMTIQAAIKACPRFYDPAYKKA